MYEYEDAFEDDEQPESSDSLLRRLNELAEEMAKRQLRVAELEDDLRDAKKSLAEIQEKELPNLMEEHKMVSFTTTSGRTITIKQDVKASITESNRAAAIQWFRETGNDRLIQNKFEAVFQRGEDQHAEELAEFLRQRKRAFKQKEGVHHSTLSAFVKERLRAGEEVPLDILNVYLRKVAKIQ